ncbi:hypothetical protein FSP39_025049 [Pinctada imbricata]|uniref:Uncharacterized protein n=1 Tax=Pinctada imbricata TaxID=66713 RepID=A0AA89BYA7_PINIB|nr:hypothetical protein FSP39_025049 [Pinctada imbricata]
MAVVHKPNGKLRICIDPQALNTALQREHYPLPVLDDILPKLQKAKIFSKLDIKEAFWHVCLDDRSSELTTMITPFGRFRWARLPFGLKVSSEIFQRKLSETLCEMEGIFPVIDDIIVAGCGETAELAREDNSAKLQNLYKKCAESNIILNDDKKELFLEEISFHGHKITSNGVKADENKVDAILKMKSPTDVSSVKRFCGMVQYMAKFLPSLSTTMEPIRVLTRKNVPWNWSAECEQAFLEVKHKLTSAPVLAYFNPDLELLLQTDSSKDGIGAVLMQNGQPIEYASRSLTTAQRKWAQIEKEALSILVGLKRFDQYTYGRTVIIENDHKPLETILRKPLSSAPRRLQDIIMEMNRYDIQFRFVKGSKLLIADTLSRSYLPTETEHERTRVLCVNEDISDSRLEKIRNETSRDKSLMDLKETIENGWPPAKHMLKDTCKPYYDMRETLSIIDGVLVKGEAIIIPKSMVSEIKSLLHSAHLGYDSMIRRARGNIFWLQMNANIKQMAENCVPCQEMKAKPMKTPLIQHSDGKGPWNKIGLDLLQIKDRNYLVSIDYYSNYIEVDYLTSTTSSQVIQILKKQFAHFGIPSIIKSDNGTQFTSSEFRKFTESWGIKHKTSSPNHQRANGKAESAVKIAKHLMIKCNREGSDPYLALMEQRNTPRQDTNLSPNEILLGRQTRTLLPSVPKDQHRKIHKRERRKRSIKKHYDKSAKHQPNLDINQNVYFELRENAKWVLGKIVKQIDKYTYIVKSQEGVTYRRNRLHIRPTAVEAVIRDKSPIRVVEPNIQVSYPVIQDPSQNPIPKIVNDTSQPLKPSEIVPVITPTSAPTQETAPLLRRSDRIRRRPAKFDDYTT